MEKKEPIHGYYPNYDSRLYKAGNPEEREDEARELLRRNESYVKKTKKHLLTAISVMFLATFLTLSWGINPVFYAVALMLMNIISFQYGKYCQLEESAKHHFLSDIWNWENKGRPTSR